MEMQEEKRRGAGRKNPIVIGWKSPLIALGLP